MYNPRPWHFVGPVSVVLIWIAIYEHLGRPWEVLIFGYWLGAISYEWSKYIQRTGVVSQMYLTNTRATNRIAEELIQEVNKEKPVETPGGFTPLVRSVKPVYTQTVAAPEGFDMERQFAKDLLRMRDFKPHDEAVDLREEKWKAHNKFGSRNAYVEVRDKWEGHKVLGRADARKNAPYKVIDWPAVELVANGTPLPPLPQ